MFVIKGNSTKFTEKRKQISFNTFKHIIWNEKIVLVKDKHCFLRIYPKSFELLTIKL